MPTIDAGFSQGGTISASVGLSAPAAVVGFGLLSGRALPELQPRIASRAQRQRMSAFVAHGRHDEKLPLFWAECSNSLLHNLDVCCKDHIYEMGHELIELEINDFFEWMISMFSTPG